MGTGFARTYACRPRSPGEAGVEDLGGRNRRHRHRKSPGSRAKLENPADAGTNRLTGPDQTATYSGWGSIRSRAEAQRHAELRLGSSAKRRLGRQRSVAENDASGLFGVRIISVLAAAPMAMPQRPVWDPSNARPVLICLPKIARHRDRGGTVCPHG